MDYTPVTAFRRPLNAALLAHQAVAQKDVPPSDVNKWEVLRELAAARISFGLSDRDLSVLQALVSFHQATILGGNTRELVVYPSNKAICERLNGMACSTMRRHLANLVQTGFVVRRDSPNGKRYARRYGDEKIAFGFDLTPLAQRFPEICEAARTVRATEERYKRLRSTVSLMRRDLAGLAVYGRSLAPDLPLWDQASDLAVLTARDLRRKLDFAELKGIKAALSEALENIRNYLEGDETEVLSTNDVSNEQHYQNSDKDSYEFEPSLENAKCESSAKSPSSSSDPDLDLDRTDRHCPTDARLPRIPLGVVLTACTEFETYAEGPVRHWHDLIKVADILRPMMGIPPSAWDDAKKSMGAEEAAVVIVAMLERFIEIRSPGGYLRSLSSKAALGEFSSGPMIMALMRKEAA